MKKIALFSLADIMNYGDVFFPYVLKNELLERMPDSEINIYTNTKADFGFFESQEYSLLECLKNDALVYAGGEMVSPWDDEPLKGLYKDSFHGKNPSDIAYEWMDSKDHFRAWFSIGAHPVLYDYPEYMNKALEKLDYLSVRGLISKKVLEQGFIINNGNIRVMPDMGWLFPKYIDRYQFTDFRNKCGLGADEEYAVFQAIDDLNIDDNAENIVKALLEFEQKTKVRILILPIMQTKAIWNEQRILNMLYNSSEGKLLLAPTGMNILEVGTILKNAKFYIGSSLHGAITAMAYGNPACNVRSAINTKLQDVHGMRDRATCFLNTWSVLLGVLERLNNEADNEVDGHYANIYADYMRYRLSREIDGLANRIKAL